MILTGGVPNRYITHFDISAILATAERGGRRARPSNPRDPSLVSELDGSSANKASITRAGSNHKSSLKLTEPDTPCDTPETIQPIQGGTEPRERSHQIRPSVERGHTLGIDQVSPGGYRTIGS